MSARSSALSVQGVRWVKYASTVVSALSARSAVGHQSASTVVYAIHARSAVGHQSASTVVSALMQGVRWGINLRARSSALSGARSAVVHQSASTVVERSQCKECGGASICEHGRQRSDARSAVGASICEHGRRRSVQGVRWVHQSASTVVSALSARSAVGHQSASTVVGALVQGVRWASICEHGRQRSSARSAVGAQSASTVVSALDARSAVGLESASTVVSASVQGVRWVCNLRARSSALSMQGVRVEQMTSVVKRRPNRDSGIAPRFIVNFYQLYRLLDRRRQPRASPPPVPPPLLLLSSLLLSQPLPGQLILAAPAALRRLTPDDRPERHTRGHPASFARSLPDPHLPSPQRIAPLIRGDPAGSGRHRERLALVVGALGPGAARV